MEPPSSWVGIPLPLSPAVAKDVLEPDRQQSVADDEMTKSAPRGRCGWLIRIVPRSLERHAQISRLRQSVAHHIKEI